MMMDNPNMRVCLRIKKIYLNRAAITLIGNPTHLRFRYDEQGGVLFFSPAAPDDLHHAAPQADHPGEGDGKRHRRTCPLHGGICHLRDIAGEQTEEQRQTHHSRPKPRHCHL